MGSECEASGHILTVVRQQGVINASAQLILYIFSFFIHSRIPIHCIVKQIQDVCFLLNETCLEIATQDCKELCL